MAAVENMQQDVGKFLIKGFGGVQDLFLTISTQKTREHRIVFVSADVASVFCQQNVIRWHRHICRSEHPI